MALLLRLSLWLACMGALLPFAPATAQAPATEQASAAGVPTIWRLLDYVAVDYPEAVQGGRVVNPMEFAEMSEFTASVREQLAKLPPSPAKDELVRSAEALQRSVAAKADAGVIEKQARSLASTLLAAYPVPLAPAEVPDLAHGATLYAQNCASCHGAEGDAKVPIAATLDPPPIDFTDRDRASQRSIFALYQVIDQGLEGTAMASFGALPAAEKWALAFHVARFSYPPELAAQGKRLWEADPALHRLVPDLAALTSLTPAALARQIGDGDKAAAVMAYLRSNPEAVAAASGPQTLSVARDKLRASLAAYEAGNREQAKALALAAYLDGFEPVEPVLAARDPGLMAKVEGAMAELRSAIAAGRPVPDVRQRVEALESLFADAERALAPSEADAAGAFLGAMTILLREGLEALLIVVAMLTFLRKSGQTEMVRPVHYGWIVALIAGFATWWAATHFLTISGASRELTEGFGSLLAAAILLFVGIWMHGKSQADQWQRYIRDKLGSALSRGSGWFLFMLAFVAVYREVFETIIFFAALSAQGQVGPLLAGAAAGLVLLGAIAVAMFRFSRRLPIGKFFAYSSALIAVLAVVLTGKGVAALQEAGWIGVTPVSGPRIELLGLYPTLQGLLAQALMILALIAGFGWNRIEARRLAVA